MPVGSHHWPFGVSLHRRLRLRSWHFEHGRERHLSLRSMWRWLGLPTGLNAGGPQVWSLRQRLLARKKGGSWSCVSAKSQGSKTPKRLLFDHGGLSGSYGKMCLETCQQSIETRKFMQLKKEPLTTLRCRPEDWCPGGKPGRGDCKVSF